MRYQRVEIASIGYQLAPNVWSSQEIEQALAPVYQTLHIQPGQLTALTGIRERRYWDPSMPVSAGALQAAQKALKSTGLSGNDIEMLVYGGVCRDNLEPATACVVGAGLNLSSSATVYDISNACLGNMNGIIQVADAIEMGRIRAGMVVSCETSKQIIDQTIQYVLENPDMETLRYALATMTGGSGAVALVLTEKGLVPDGHRLLGGIVRNKVEYHGLSRWGPDTGIPASRPTVMVIDAVKTLQHGVALGAETWQLFLDELGWTPQQVDRVICHQVGESNKLAILKAIGVPPEKDYSTYPFLGNIGTVSLPLTAALAHERGVLKPRHHVGFLGIGSGLNCLMLGLEW